MATLLEQLVIVQTRVHIVHQELNDLSMWILEHNTRKDGALGGGDVAQVITKLQNIMALIGKDT